MKKFFKIFKPIGYCLLSSACFFGYFYLENNILVWLYDSTYVGLTAVSLLAIALAAFFLSGKRAIKMLEWPTLSIVSALLLACFTKLAK